MDPGFVSDGEWNSLRTRGTERPVQLLTLIKEAKDEALAMKAFEIYELFQPKLIGNQLYATSHFCFES